MKCRHLMLVFTTSQNKILKLKSFCLALLYVLESPTKAAVNVECLAWFLSLAKAIDQVAKVAMIAQQTTSSVVHLAGWLLEVFRADMETVKQCSTASVALTKLPSSLWNPVWSLEWVCTEVLTKALNLSHCRFTEYFKTWSLICWLVAGAAVLVAQVNHQPPSWPSSSQASLWRTCFEGLV